MIGFRSFELVPEDAAQSAVGTLRHTGGVERGLALPRVVVDIEVSRAQDLEIEDLILQLVAPELGASLFGDCDQQQRHERRDSQSRPRRQNGTAPARSSHRVPGSSIKAIGASPHSRSS